MGNLYVGCNVSPARIVAVDIDSFTRIGALTLSSGNNGVRSMARNLAAGQVYVGNVVLPGRIVAVNIPALTEGGTVDFPVGSGWPNEGAYVAATDRFVCGDSDNTAQIHKIVASTWTYDSGIFAGAGKANAQGLVVDTIAGEYYYSYDGAPYGAHKRRISDDALLGDVGFLGGEIFPECLAIDRVRGYVYIGLWISPAVLVRVATAAWSRVDSLTFATGANQVNRLLLNTADGYLYAGCRGVPGRVVKVDLDTWAVVSTLVLNSGESNVYDIAIDAANDILYAVCNTNPTRLVKVQMSTMSRVSALILASGENLGVAVQSDIAESVGADHTPMMGIGP